MMRLLLPGRQLSLMEVSIALARCFEEALAHRGLLNVCLLSFGEANEGGQVDDRTISSGRTRMFRTLSSLASRRRRSSAAVAPISCSGWRIGVSAGDAVRVKSR